MTKVTISPIGRPRPIPIILTAVALAVAACGNGAGPSTIEEPATPATAASVADPTSTATTTPQITSTTVSTTAASTTSTLPAAPAFSVATYGAGPIGPLDGSGGMLGSGCAPGPGPLPDGVWFGMVDSTYGNGIKFDLCCLHPGDPVTVTNVNPQLRDVFVADETTIAMADGSQVAYANWSPDDVFVWAFVNGGTATEIAYPTMAVATSAPGSTTWEASSDAALPVGGGCCSMNYTGPASPTDPWPTQGMPADGVYAVSVTFDVAADDLVLTISRFVPCAEHPEVCRPDPLDGDLGIASDSIVRRTPLDGDLTVRIEGVEPDPADEASIAVGIEGAGAAFALLMDGMNTAWDTEVVPLLDAGLDYGSILTELKDRGEADPSYPYGPASSWMIPGGPLVYRGPLGSQLLFVFDEPNLLRGWSTQLEIVGGDPILYIWAGQLAG